MKAFCLSRVVVVDADKDLISQATRVLKRCGAREIVHCNSLRAASAYLRDGGYDFVLVDIEPADLDGPRPTEVLFPDQAERTPILYAVTVVHRSDVKSLQEAECQPYLTKPLNDNILEQQIRKLFDEEGDTDHELENLVLIKEAIEKGEIVRAKALLEPALRRHPFSTRYLELQGEALFRAGDYDAAQIVVSRVLSQHPDYLPAINLASKLYIRTKRYDEAFNLTEGATEHALERLTTQEKADTRTPDTTLSPHEEVSALNAKAVALMKEGEVFSALTLYEEAFAKSEGMNKRYSLMYNMALGYFRAGNMDRARFLCQECSQEAPPGFKKATELLQRIKKTEDEIESALGKPVLESIMPSVTPEEPSLQLWPDEVSAPPIPGSISQTKAPQQPAQHPGTSAPSVELTQTEEEKVLRFIMFQDKL